MNKFIRRAKAYNYEGTREFKNLSDLELGKEYRVLGFFVTNGMFGETPVVVIDEYNVNLPTHRLQAVTSIMADSDATDEINAGHLLMRVYEYESHGGKHRSASFVLRG